MHGFCLICSQRGTVTKFNTQSDRFEALSWDCRHTWNNFVGVGEYAATITHSWFTTNTFETKLNSVQWFSLVFFSFVLINVVVYRSLMWIYVIDSRCEWVANWQMEYTSMTTIITTTRYNNNKQFKLKNFKNYSATELSIFGIVSLSWVFNFDSTVKKHTTIVHCSGLVLFPFFSRLVITYILTLSVAFCFFEFSVFFSYI